MISCNNECEEEVTCKSPYPPCLLTCIAPATTASCTGNSVCTSDTTSVTCDGTTVSCPTTSQCRSSGAYVQCGDYFQQCTLHCST
jgi:hypothetical protein